jgi:hypothetical protein
MAGASNTFDGGTNGAAITPANSGGASGTAFAVADSITYSSVHAHRGPLSAEIAPDAIGYVQYPLSGSGVRYARWYARPNNAINSLIEMELASGDLVGLDISGGQIILWRITDFDPTNLDTAPFAIPSGWVRLELQASSAAGGAAAARIYTNPESDVPAIELSGSDGAPASTWSAVRFAAVNQGTTPVWIDSVAWSDQGWIGPLPAAGSPPAVLTSPAAAHRAATW